MRADTVSSGHEASIVRFENVGLRYGLGPEVLQDVTFSLAPGSFHFLLGESGAGKSSLLKLIYLALRPSRGLISLFGNDIATTVRDALPALRRRVGAVVRGRAAGARGGPAISGEPPVRARDTGLGLGFTRVAVERAAGARVAVAVAGLVHI